MVNSKGGIPIKKVFVLALLMASVTSFSKSIIPINIKGALGIKVETVPTILTLVSLDSEVEARAYDIKFTDLISMENNVGVSAGISANLPAKNIRKNGASPTRGNGDIKAFSTMTFEVLAYYQPSIKFKVLDDLALKVGLKVGAGATLGFDVNSKITYHKSFPTFVSSFIAGAEYKNIIIETELVADTRLDWKTNDTDMMSASAESMGTQPLKAMVFPNFKIKVGYRF